MLGNCAKISHCLSVCYLIYYYHFCKSLGILPTSNWTKSCWDTGNNGQLTHTSGWFIRQTSQGVYRLIRMQYGKKILDFILTIFNEQTAQMELRPTYFVISTFYSNSKQGSLNMQPAFQEISPGNDVWETSTEMPYCRRITTQIWVGLLIGHARWKICFSQSEAPPRSW